jgi:hypothetical protein
MSEPYHTTAQGHDQAKCADVPSLDFGFQRYLNPAENHILSTAIDRASDTRMFREALHYLLNKLTRAGATPPSTIHLEDYIEPPRSVKEFEARTKPAERPRKDAVNNDADLPTETQPSPAYLKWLAQMEKANASLSLPFPLNPEVLKVFASYALYEHRQTISTAINARRSESALDRITGAVNNLARSGKIDCSDNELRLITDAVFILHCEMEEELSRLLLNQAGG